MTAGSRPGAPHRPPLTDRSSPRTPGQRGYCSAAGAGAGGRAENCQKHGPQAPNSRLDSPQLPPAVAPTTGSRPDPRPAHRPAAPGSRPASPRSSRRPADLPPRHRPPRSPSPRDPLTLALLQPLVPHPTPAPPTPRPLPRQAPPRPPSQNRYPPLLTAVRSGRRSRIPAGRAPRPAAQAYPLPPPPGRGL